MCAAQPDSNPSAPRGQAPSEKHLENYLWENPESLGWLDISPFGSVPLVDFKWRQVRLPAGTVDLVGSYLDHSLLITEIKKGPIDNAAFAQLMRYMHDFKAVLFNVFEKYQEIRQPDWKLTARHPLVHSNWEDTLLKGALIGHSCKDDSLLIACEACNIKVFLYEFTEGEYHLTSSTAGMRWAAATYGATLNAVQNGIEAKLIRYIDERLDFERGHTASPQWWKFDAAMAAEEHIDDLLDRDRQS